MRNATRSLMLFLALLLPLTATAQGTTYISNLDQTPTDSEAVASDSWWAQVFSTGIDPNGYVLNSVQLRTDASSGAPAGFDLSLYGSNGLRPASSLGQLIGPDPTTGGIYTFAGSGILLAPSTYYFVVATGNTPSSQGSFGWSMTNPSGTVSGWAIPNVGRYRSTDGANWSFAGRLDVFQLAIDATAVPEPTVVTLAGLGLAALYLFLRRPSRAGKFRLHGQP